MNFFEKLCKENDLIVQSFMIGVERKIGGFYRTNFDIGKSLIWNIPISNYKNAYGIIYQDKELLTVLTNITYDGEKRLIAEGQWDYIKYEDSNLNEYIRNAKSLINKYKLHYDLFKQEEKLKKIEEDFK